MEVSFISDFKPLYNRNNKSGGQKNVQCFPSCRDDGHRKGGWCGKSVVVAVSLSPAYKNNSLISVGYFKPEDELDLPANRMSMAEIKANTNNQENPFGNYFFASKTKVNEKEVQFEFNKEKKGWQYNWISSKANRDLKHVFVVNVYESQSDEYVNLVSSISSSKFYMYCTKRPFQLTNTKTKSPRVISGSFEPIFTIPFPISSPLLDDGDNNLSASYPTTTTVSNQKEDNRKKRKNGSISRRAESDESKRSKKTNKGSDLLSPFTTSSTVSSLFDENESSTSNDTSYFILNEDYNESFIANPVAIDEIPEDLNQIWKEKSFIEKPRGDSLIDCIEASWNNESLLLSSDSFIFHKGNGNKLNLQQPPINPSISCIPSAPSLVKISSLHPNDNNHCCNPTYRMDHDFSLYNKRKSSKIDEKGFITLSPSFFNLSHFLRKIMDCKTFIIFCILSMSFVSSMIVILRNFPSSTADSKSITPTLSPTAPTLATTVPSQPSSPHSVSCNIKYSDVCSSDLLEQGYCVSSSANCGLGSSWCNSESLWTASCSHLPSVPSDPSADQRYCGTGWSTLDCNKKCFDRNDCSSELNCYPQTKKVAGAFCPAPPLVVPGPNLAHPPAAIGNLAHVSLRGLSSTKN